MFPRDPSESSRRQKRSPSPADHSGSNSSPSREYSPPAARRRQTSRAPAKSTTHKHNFSPSRRWEVNSVDFISFNSSGLETFSLVLLLVYVSVVNVFVPQRLELFFFFLPSYCIKGTRHVKNTSHEVSIYQFLSNVLPSGRTSEVWHEIQSVCEPSGTFLLPNLPAFKKQNIEKSFTFEMGNRQSFSLVEWVKWYTGPGSAHLSWEAGTTG